MLTRLRIANKTLKSSINIMLACHKPKIGKGTHTTDLNTEINSMDKK